MTKIDFVFLLILFGACQDSTLPAPNVVQSPRIIAIRATPSVFHAAEDGPVTELEALVVDSTATPLEASVRWRVCDPRVIVSNPYVDCGSDSSFPLTSTSGLTTEISRQDIPIEIEIPPPQPPPTEGCNPLPPTIPTITIVAEARVEGTNLATIKRVPIQFPDYPVLPSMNPTLMAVNSSDRVEGELSLDSIEEFCSPESNEQEFEDVDVYIYGSRPIQGHITEYRDGELDSSDLDDHEEPGQWRWDRNAGNAIVIAVDQFGGIEWVTSPPD